MNAREISENILKQLPGKVDPILLKHLWDNKPLLKSIITEKIFRNENGKMYCYTYSLLHAMARFGREELMKKFLIAESMVDCRDDYKRTPLWYAAAYNKLQTLEVLLKHGARVRLKDHRGWTALHVAAINGHYDICEVLLHFGANPTEPDNCGFSPLHKAVWSTNIKLVQLFINLSSDSIDSSSFNSGLHPLHLSTLKNIPVICKLLLKNGAMINCQTVDGITPLILASQHSYDNLCHLFIKTSNVEETTKSGWTALHMAAFYGSVSCVECLIENSQGYPINPYNGWSPLHVAAWQGHLEIVEILLKSININVLLKSYSGLTAIDLAAQNGHSIVLTKLLENCAPGYNGPALHLASVSGQKHSALVLINLAKVNINQFWAPNDGNLSNVEYSPIQYAVFAGQREIVCLLLIHGAKIFDAIGAYLKVIINRCDYSWLKSILKLFNLFAFY